MFQPRPCGCKGQRTCLLCEKEMGEQVMPSWVTQSQKEHAIVYCPECDLAWPGWDTNTWKCHPNHQGEGTVWVETLLRHSIRTILSGSAIDESFKSLIYKFPFLPLIFYFLNIFFLLPLTLAKLAF
ncbi:hypothetical protein E2C01_097137 [Portunus trituberculatus]|uniref:Uncharacterized protein n=1 Tax=Portunus trituberculatus TaxID=210409 RepID=A0A5B7JZN6_PORTR|nr:hypothetical protein [Portunus trituberculatus]